MDERAVTERFHEALDVEPRAGAYERFRADFVTPPAAAKRRPVFRLRFSTMTLRVAAAVAVVAIAIALVAGFLAIHHPTAVVPASPDKQVIAYQSLMRTDDAAVGATFSSHCANVSDTGCVAALGRISTPLQKWVADLNALKAPPQFAVIDTQVRQHIAATLSDLNFATAAVGARDNHALANAINAGAFQAGWLQRATSAIAAWQRVTASTYTAQVSSDGQSLNLCAGCQAITASAYAACTGTRVDVCISDVMPADDTIGQIEADVISTAAPAGLATKDHQLQTDLAAADSALTGMLDALLAGDTATISASESAYRAAMTAVTADITAITG